MVSYTEFRSFGTVTVRPMSTAEWGDHYRYLGIQPCRRQPFEDLGPDAMRSVLGPRPTVVRLTGALHGAVGLRRFVITFGREIVKADRRRLTLRRQAMRKGRRGWKHGGGW